MSQTHHHGTMLPQDTNFDNADQPGIAQSFSQSEIEELLFGNDRPLADRLARLREIRSELVARESADWGDDDPQALLVEVDRAIDALSTDSADANDTDDYASLSAPFESEPDLDSLSPDDVEAREAIEGEDEEIYVDDDPDEPGILDESEWDEGDDFKPERGTH